MYNGSKKDNGSLFPATDNCNTCTCTDGTVDCTERSCQVGVSRSKKLKEKGSVKAQVSEITLINNVIVCTQRTHVYIPNTVLEIQVRKFNLQSN